MVNFGLNSASILGIVLAVAGAALYFLRSVRPELARDHDIFFAAVGLLCGFILLFQGWRLDPILQFGQLLLTGTTVFFAVESIRLRSVATEQARRNTRVVDDERPVSSVYRYDTVRAELDELEPVDDDEERFSRPQIRGSKERSTRTDEYEDEPRRRTRYRDEYGDEPPRRSTSRSSNTGSQSQRPGQSKRTSRPVSRPTERSEEDEWSSTKQTGDEWDASGNSDRSSSRPSTNGNRLDRNQDVLRPKKRTRPAQNSVNQRQQDESATPTDYVDYQPVNHPDEESDNSSNFDDL